MTDHTEHVEIALTDELLGIRRRLHRHPERSFKEFETSMRLRNLLESHGITVLDNPLDTGVIGEIKGEHDGPQIGLRADIDALPVHEDSGLVFASENEGVMHACGHDNHMAMLLGAAHILLEKKDELKGKVKFLLQSGEEMACGAKYYVDHHILDGVDAIFGQHIWGTLDAPYVCVASGNRMASCDNFTIRVKGLQSHGSAPQDGHDAIVAASAIVMALQTYVSRKNNPVNPLVVTVGKFHGGSMYNIICPDVELVGTIRTYSRELRHDLEADLNKIIKNTAEAHDCTAELEFSPMLPAVINEDHELNEIAQNAALKLFGPEGVNNEMPALMGSEDFALFMEKIPAFFAFIGSRNVEKGLIYTNHNEKYTVDESVLWRGSALTAQFAYDFLNNK